MADTRNNDSQVLAVEVAELRTEVAGIKERMTQGFDHLTRVVDEMRLQQMEFVRHQERSAGHGNQIEAAFDAIEKLTAEVSTIAGTVKTFHGGFRGAKWAFGIVFGLLLSIAGVAFNSKMQLIDERVSNLKTLHDKDMETAQMRLQVLEATHQLEYGPGQQVRP